MRALCAAALLALAQAPALEVDASFKGTPAEALATVARLAPGEPERAAALAKGLAEDAARPEGLRAEFRYAEGLVLAGAGGDAAAAQSFASARALAGPGELRTAATYNQGTVELRAAEALRLATFKELQDPAAAGAPPAAAGGDPLRALRESYLRAKATLLERLRADFSDADTRANLELIQRRLRELDELERQAEEEQQKQQQEQDQKDGQQGEQGDQKDQGEGEGEPKDQDGEGGQQDQGQEQQAGQKPDQKPGDAGGAADPLQAMPPSGELPDVKPGGEPQGQPAERVLSKEEVLRLLDRLGAIEDEAQALEALLRANQRIPVDKDW